ncbi:glycosyltransferase [Aeromonas caviae]
MALPSKPIHILIIPSWYPRTPSDIGGSFFREQAIALKKRGHQVGVITPCLRSLREWTNIFKRYGIVHEVDEGIPTLRYHGMSLTPGLDILSEKTWVYWGLQLFSEYIKIYGRPDIIHVHSLDKGALLAFDIYKRFGIPYVVTEHSSSFARGLVSSAKKQRLHKAVMAAQATIAVSQPFADLLNKSFDGSNWFYIPNIVSNKFIQAELELNSKKNVPFTFLNICLLTENKCVDKLITAFSLLAKKYEQLRLEIGGDGVCKPALEALVVQLGITEQVKFLGALSREQVIAHMQRADAFVLASEYETFGVVLVEALALGKPIVATRSGGPESIVTDEVGVLVDKNSVAALRDGMEEVYQQRHSYCAADIKAYCYNNFSEAAVTAKLTEIYQRVVQAKFTTSQIE